MNRQEELVIAKARMTPYVRYMIGLEQKKLGRRLTNGEVLKYMENRLVCPKCESFALRGQGHTPDNPVGHCGRCGYHGPMFTVSDYITGKWYK